MMDVITIESGGVIITLDESQVVVEFEEHKVIIGAELFNYAARQLIELQNSKPSKASR